MSKNGWRMPMDKGYPLPEDHLPVGRVCVQFEIPDDQTYAADVIGHIMELGKWWNWEKDGGLDRRATETAQLFRKALYETLCVEKYRPMGCNCPDPSTYLYQVDEDGNILVSTDGGTVYVPISNDPRITAPILPLLPGEPGDTKQCQAAVNVRTHVQSKADKIKADANAWAGVTEMIAALIGFLIFLGVIGTGGALTPVLLVFAGAMLSAGQGAFAAAMTDDVYQQFQCFVFCHMTDDGVLEDGGLDAIIADINDGITGIANSFLVSTLHTMGVNGINNMAKTGSGEGVDAGDCDICHCDETWCKVFDFSIQSYSAYWSSYDADSNPAVFNTHYNEAGYWQTDNGNPNYSIIKIPKLWGGHLTRVTIQEDPDSDNMFMGLLPSAGGDVVVNYGISDRFYDGSEPSYTYLAVGQRSRAKIRKVTLHGTGSNPFGADNC